MGLVNEDAPVPSNLTTVRAGGVGTIRQLEKGSRGMKMHRDRPSRHEREAREARYESQVGGYYEQLPARQDAERLGAELVVRRGLARPWTPEQIDLLESMGVRVLDFEGDPDDGGDAA